MSLHQKREIIKNYIDILEKGVYIIAKQICCLVTWHNIKVISHAYVIVHCNQIFCNDNLVKLNAYSQPIDELVKRYKC